MVFVSDKRFKIVSGTEGVQWNSSQFTLDRSTGMHTHNTDRWRCARVLVFHLPNLSEIQGGGGAIIRIEGGKYK